MDNHSAPGFEIHVIGEEFQVKFLERSLPCLALRINGRIVYRVHFRASYLYITKSINQHGIPFWTSIPQDAKLRSVTARIGAALEDHLIETLCVTTTALR